jgi:rod shape-determining protein MreD
VVAVIATFVWSTEAGMTLAFVGGLMIDLLAPRPVGLTAFTLLVSTGIAAVLGRLIQRGLIVTPIVLIFVLTFVTDLLFLAMFAALRGRLDVGDPIQLILPGALYSTAVAVVLAPLAAALHKRFAERERVAW